MNHRGKEAVHARDDNFVQQLRSDFAKTAEHKQILRMGDAKEKHNVVGTGRVRRGQILMFGFLMCKVNE